MSINDPITQIAANMDYTYRGPVDAIAVGGSEPARNFALQLFQDVGVLRGPAQQALIGATVGLSTGDAVLAGAGALIGAANGMLGGKPKGRGV